MRRTRRATGLGQTPSQTVGPYFAYGLTPEQYGYAHTSIASGALVPARPRVSTSASKDACFDGKGAAISDAMIEIWQADSQGRYAHPADPRGSNCGFKGFGRVGTGTDPEQRFHVRHDQARLGRWLAGAASQRDRLHARVAEPRLHAALFLR